MIGRKLVSYLFFVLLIMSGNVTFSNPTYTENFSSTGNLSENTGIVSGGYFRDGRPYGYYSSHDFRYNWGDFAYYNGYFYVVWSDDRYDGILHVFMQKIDTSGNIAWSSNVVVDDLIGEATRPTIAIYDQNHIYVVWVEETNGFHEVRAQRFSDSGTLNRYYDTAGTNMLPYYGSQSKFNPWLLDAEVDSSGNLIVSVNYYWTGSGRYIRFQKMDETGAYLWGDDGWGWAFYTYPFANGVQLKLVDDNLYILADRWKWGSYNTGISIQKMTVPDSEGSISKLWGSDGIEISGFSGDLYGYPAYVLCPLEFSTNDGYIYAAWVDWRSGTYDVYLDKISTNDGSSAWASDVLVNSNTTGNQYTPELALDSSGNIYVVWIYGSNIYLRKLNNSGSTLSADVVLAKGSGSSYAYHPRVLIIDDYLYVAWLDSANYRNIRIAKYNLSDFSQVWYKELRDVSYKKVSHATSKATTFSPPVGTVKSVKMTTALVSNAHEVLYYVSPDDGSTWYQITNNQDLTFTNAGVAFRYKVVLNGAGTNYASVDWVKFEATEHYTGDLKVGTNTSSYVGADYLNLNPTYQNVENYTVADGNSDVFYVSLTNLGNSSGDFYIMGSVGDSSWDIKYYDGATEITPYMTSSTGYLVTSLAASNEKVIRVVATPSPYISDGAQKDILIYAAINPGADFHDSASLTAVGWRYRPDFAFKFAGGSYVGQGFVETATTPSVQVLSTDANAFLDGYREAITNYILITNMGISTDTVVLDRSLSVSSGSLSDWELYAYNVTLGGTPISFPYTNDVAPSNNFVIMTVARPKVSVPEGAVITFDYTLKSTNTNPADDSLRIDHARVQITAIKVQPDLTISTNSLFLTAVGANEYFWTNTSITNSLMARTVNDMTITFYIKLENDGDTTENITLKAYPITNSGWTAKYYDGISSTVEISSSITSSGGMVVSMNGGSVKYIRAEYTPDSTVDSGDEPWVKVEAVSGNRSYVYDAVWIRPRNIKVYPDVCVSTQSNAGFSAYASYVTNFGNDTELIASNQVRSRRLEHGETGIYYIIVSNGSPTDPDDITVKGTAGDSDWIVRYYDESTGDEISYSITNTGGTNVSIPFGGFWKIRCEVTPQVSVPADAVKKIYVDVNSTWVSAQKDEVLISNICVELAPDVALKGDGGWVVPNLTFGSYTDQVASAKIRASLEVTNTYYIQVSNTGGSVEDYRLKVQLSNYGGSLADWKVWFYDSGMFDITADVTNDGWVKTFSSNEGEVITVKVTVVSNLETLGNESTTHGAVSNELHLLTQFESMTKPYPLKYDRGDLKIQIEKGMPDAYHTLANFRMNVIDGDFTSANVVTYGAVLGIQGNASFRFKNIGTYDDLFRIRAEVSNEAGTVGNWHWYFKDPSGNDITASLTNTGWNVDLSSTAETNITMYYSNADGVVGDRIAVRFWFETRTMQKRTDVLWYKVEIVPGLPDILATNVVEGGPLVGTNRFSSHSYISEKIELTNQDNLPETNTSRLVMWNIAPVSGGASGEADFKLKELAVYGNTSSFSISYTDPVSGSTVSRSDVQNGVTYTLISKNSSVSGIKETNIDVHIVANSSASSGDWIAVLYRFYLATNESVYDDFWVTNVFVDPNVDVTFKSTNTNLIHVYLKPGDSSGWEIRVQNVDAVSENMKINGASDPSGKFRVNYWHLVGSFSNNQTSSITNGTYMTSEISSSNYDRFFIAVESTSNVVSGDSYAFTFKATTSKNSNRFDEVTFLVESVWATADLWLSNENVYYGNNQYKNPYEYKDTVQASTDKIEYQETNVYWLALENDISTGSNVVFLLEEDKDSVMSSYFTVNYYDGATPINLSSGYEVSLAYGERKLIKVEVIQSSSLLASGGIGTVSWYMHTRDVVGYEDRLSLSVQKVAPQLSSYIVGETTNFVHRYMKKGDTVEVSIRVKNEDAVWDSVKFIAPPSNNAFSAQYLYISPDGTSTNNITSSITNGGWVKTIGAGSSERFNVRYQALDSGISGDMLLGYFKAISMKNTNVSTAETNELELVEGLIDLWISNVMTNWGGDVYSNLVSMTDRIEYGYTNEYWLYVGNDVSTGSNVVIVLDETMNNTNGWEVIIISNGTPVPSIDGAEVSVAAGEQAEFRILLVVTDSSVLSGTIAQIKFSGFLRDVASETDSVQIDSMKVTPDVSAIMPDYSTNYRYTIKRPGESETVRVRIRNDDVVPDTMVITGPSGVNNLSVKYFTVSGSSTNYITGQVTNQGWTVDIEGGWYQDVYIQVDVDLAAVSGLRRDVILTATSEGRTNHFASVTNIVEVIDATVDMWISNSEIVFGTNVYLPTSQAETDRIELYETNEYYLVIENDKASGSNVVFVVRQEVDDINNEFDVKVYRGTTEISLDGMEVSLAAGESTNFRIVVVSTNTNDSGTIGSFRFWAYTKLIDQSTDEVRLFSLKVNPQVDVQIAGYTTNYKFDYVREGTHIDRWIYVMNNDKVNENMLLQADPGNSQISVKYYHVKGASVNDITAQITNEGYLLGVRGNRYERILASWDIASNALTGDRKVFGFKATTSKNSNRFDVVTNDFEVVNATVDVSLSNFFTNLGYNEFYPTSQVYTNDAEYGFTNEYILLIRNTNQDGGSNVTFYIDETKIGFSIYDFKIYDTNGNEVAGDSLDGKTISLRSGESIWYRIVAIETDNTVPSGVLARLEYRVYATVMGSIQDSVELYSRKVDPRVTVSMLGYPSNNIMEYVQGGVNRDIVFRVENGDEVSSDMWMHSSGSWRYFEVRYYHIYGSTTNEITSSITDTGWTYTIPANDSIDILMHLETATNSPSGDEMHIDFIARTLKNTNRYDSAHYYLKIVEAQPDVSFEWRGNRYGDDIYNEGPGQWVSNRIEFGETNELMLVLENDYPFEGSNVVFAFREIREGSDNFDVKVFDGAVPVDLTNTNISLAAGETKEFRVLIIATDSNQVSGDWLKVTYKMYAKNMTNIIDSAGMYVVKMNPNPDLKSATPLDRILKVSGYDDDSKTVYAYRNVASSIYVALVNADNVWDTYGVELTVVPGENTDLSHWQISYSLSELESPDNKFTHNDTDSAYLAIALTNGSYRITMKGHESWRLRIAAMPKSQALGGENITFIVRMWSTKNTSKYDVVTNYVVVGHGEVRGYVFDKKTGKPIKGATVKVVDPYGVTNQTTTSNDGRFVVTVYPSVNSFFTVIASAENYITASTNVLYTKSGADATLRLIAVNMSADQVNARSFPNPASADTGCNILYSVPSEGDVYVAIFDIVGRLVKKIHEGHSSAGVHHVFWDGTDENGMKVGRGVYFLIIKTPDKTVIKKVFLK